MSVYLFITFSCVFVSSAIPSNSGAPFDIAYPVNVLEHSNLTLECNTSDIANVTEFYWTRSDHHDGQGRVYSWGWLLEVVDITRGESGLYICHALDNVTGENVTVGDALVDVQYPPTPDYPPRRVYSTTVYHNASFTLTVTANPVPTFTWSRDDNKPFGDVDIENNTRDAILTFYNVTVNDFGNYTLTVNNSVGSYKEHFTLLAYGTPERPYDLRAYNITYNSVDLAWTSGYDMGTHQTFTVMRWLVNYYIPIFPVVNESYENGGIGQTWTYHMSGLRGNTPYMFEIIARNAENFSISTPVMFTTKLAPSTIHVPTSTPSTSPTIASTSSSNNAPIIGVSVGLGVAIITATAVVAYLVYRRRHKYQFNVSAKYVA